MIDSVVTRLNSALEGRYFVEREAGEGGMAKVYLADDLRHERKVAIKVLNPDLAALVGAERFLAEIKTTANLQHPHILPLFDSGEADGFVFYVMPYVEGESLRGRLDHDVQLPVEEAVRIATAVANALGYAHRQGVIHRDVKPENVLMHEGEPLVSDFGIALAVTAASGNRMTETGLSLGTPFYMSPEQASADRELGPQSDVYSVGCMLYEMLVGEPPHTGKTAQSVLAKILTERPRSITDIRGTVPEHIASTVSRALERLPADRFESAEDFVRALGDSGFTHEVKVSSGTRATPTPPAASQAKGSAAARWLPWGVAAAALAVAAWGLLPEPAAAPAPTYRVALSDFVVENSGGGFSSLAVSRDGSTIVAAGPDDLLFQRRSDATEFRAIPGTEGAYAPDVSPDGEWLVFTQGMELKKTQLVGGPVLPITGRGFMPHWFDQDEIVYSTGPGISVVSAAGGTPREIIDDGFRPFMLPGGEGLLFDTNEGLELLDISTGERTMIALGGVHSRYLPTGHILYGDRSVQSMLAVPFDLATLTVTGDPVPVLPSVNVRGGGGAQLAVSDNGLLVHAYSLGATGGNFGLTWLDMNGQADRLPLEAPDAEGPRISRDGNRVAYLDDATEQVIVYNVQTGEQTRVTDGPQNFATSAWSLDGTRLYHSERVSAGSWRWVATAVDGSGEAEELIAEAAGRLNTLSPDGKWLIGEGSAAETQPDIVYARVDSGDVQLQTYLRAAWHEEEGEVSPDGRWIVYVSNEGESHGIYIRSFPESGPFTLVAEAGGGPLWSPNGDAVYYMRDNVMRRRDVRLGESVELGEETDLFVVPAIRTSVSYRNWDLHPDGDRFLFMASEVPAEQALEPIQGIGPVVIVVNWFDELRARMGEGN